MGRENMDERTAWNQDSDIRFWGGLWQVVLGGVGYPYILGSLNRALGCVGTSRAKTSGVVLHAW